MRYLFLSELEDIIEESFDVLHPRYAQDVAVEVRRHLERSIDNNYEMRFVLMDRETGQLHSRQFFATMQEAEEATKKTEHENCAVATLLVEM